MDESAFEQIAAEEWANVPERFAKHVENVALLVEDEPNEALRAEEHLSEHETLLGRYHGIPNTERGSHYGEGVTLPDTITLYRLPILMEAQEFFDDPARAGEFADFSAAVRLAVRETLWHEVAHYFGFDEEHVRTREHEGTNEFA